jgi:crotonobetainyl-CoA hydratase
MSDETTTIEPAFLRREGAVGVLVLNRPEAMNAVNGPMAVRVGEALEEVRHDRELHVVVVTGAGRAFCAGADLKELAAGRPIIDTQHPEWGFAGFVQHYLDKPVIAAVNGFALGGGTEMVLASDIAVIGRSTLLGLPEVTRGLMAGAGGAIRLSRQMPPKRAAEMLYTGAPIDAETALALGLVNRVADDKAVLDVALALAERIAGNAPLAVQATKKLAHQSKAFGSDWDPELWRLNNEEFTGLLDTQDAREGAMAFAEKRRPVWSGR